MKAKIIKQTKLRTQSKKAKLKPKPKVVKVVKSEPVKKKRATYGQGNRRRKYLGKFHTESEIAAIKRKEDIMDLFKNKDGQIIFVDKGETK